MADNSLICIKNIPENVSFGSFTPTINQVWFARDINYKNFNCVTITGITDDPLSTVTLSGGPYTDCYECFSQNYGIIKLTACVGGFGISIPVSGFTGINYLPNRNDVFYLDINYPTGQNSTRQVKTCFYVESVFLSNKTEFNDGLFNNKFASLNLPVTPLISCEECISANSVTTLVGRCGSADKDYVSILNPSQYIGNVISYTNSIDVFCGIVDGTAPTQTPNYTFISLIGDGKSCQTCLDIGNDKRIITNCVDGTEEVVWASSLYQLGETSSLSTDLGCYTVGELTESAVTLNFTLDFDPQPGCEPCIECNGVEYSYYYCNNPSITGTVTSYQVIDENEIFYHPEIGECCVRTAVSPLLGFYSEIYSTQTFGLESEDGCVDCETTSSSFTLWRTLECGVSDNQYYVITSSGLNVDDIVKIKWGRNEFKCVQLFEEVLGEYSSVWYDSVRDGSNNTIFYTGCTDCQTNFNIGVTVINCDTDSESYVSLSYNDYNSLNLFDTFLDTNGNCHTVVNSCPIPLTATTIQLSIFESYPNCSYCNSQRTNITYSAGTPYEVCVICEDCCGSGTTATSVSTPHPTWTRTDGSAVVLLDAVQLGGMFGLNS